MQLLLPEHRSGPRHVTEIERRRAQAPHALRLAEECAEHIDHSLAILAHAIRKPGADERVDS
jgi:hypothetical protein